MTTFATPLNTSTRTLSGPVFPGFTIPFSEHDVAVSATAMRAALQVLMRIGVFLGG